MRKEEKSQQGRGTYRFTQIGKGTSLAFGFTGLLLVLSSLGISHGILQEQDMEKITVATSAIGVFLGALFTNRGGGTLYGILVSLFFILGILSVKFLIYHNGNISAWSVITILSVLFSGMLSGFLLKGKRQRGKRSRK